MKRLALLALAVTTLAGCSTFADKMARCKSYGITPDTCARLIAQERQQMIAAYAAAPRAPVRQFQPVQYPSYALPVNIDHPQPVQQSYAQPMQNLSVTPLPQVQRKPNLLQQETDRRAAEQNYRLQQMDADKRAGMIIHAINPNIGRVVPNQY